MGNCYSKRSSETASPLIPPPSALHRDAVRADHQEVQDSLDTLDNIAITLANHSQRGGGGATSIISEAAHVIDTALEGTAFSLDAGDTIYELAKAGGAGGAEDLQTMIQDAASVIGRTACDLFPALLSLAETVPFVGPLAKISLAFYGTVKSYLENKEDLKVLESEVQDCLVWFKQTGDCILMLSQEHITQLKGHLTKLVGAIAEAIKMMQAWKERWTASKLLLSHQDKENISSLVQQVVKARSDISFHSTSVLFQMLLHARKGQKPDLQELRKLVGEVETSFTSDIVIHLSRFLPGSRNWMHAMVRAWLESDDSRMFWVQADAGMGKSAFAASLVEYLEPRGQLAACFFCKYGSRSRSCEEAIVLSLAYQIADRYPECRDDIVEELRAAKVDPSVWKGRSMKEKMAALLFAPLKNLQQQDKPVVLVVDALDEIGTYGSKERKDLLKVLVDCLVLLPKWVKILTTSRPEKDILACFEKFPATVISAEDPLHLEDLRVYIRAELQDYLSVPAAADTIQQNEAMSKAVTLLMQKSRGRFVYMSLVARDLFVDKQRKYSLEQLQDALPNGLDEVYLQSFERLRNAGVKRFRQTVWPLVCMLVYMLEPLQVSDAQRLMACSNEEMEALVTLLGGLFPVVGEEDGSRCFTLFHKTLADWLIDEKKSFKAAEENQLTLHCLQELLYDTNVAVVRGYMTVLEEEDLCGFDTLESVCANNDLWQQVKLPLGSKLKIQQYVQSRRRSDVEAGGGGVRRRIEVMYDFFVDGQDAHEVYSERMLSLLGLSYNGKDGPMDMFLGPQKMVEACSCSYLLSHMVQHLVDAGHVQAAQSLLLQPQWLFSSMKHRRRGFWDLLNDIRYGLLRKGVNTDSISHHTTAKAGGQHHKEVFSSASSLSQSLRLLEQGMFMSVSALALCASSDEDVSMAFALLVVCRLRDAANKKSNEALLPPLQRLLISCEEFLKEVKHVVPVSFTLEAPGGPLLATLRGHNECVTSISLSLDGSSIVSGSHDRTIKVWDTASGECLQTLTGHLSSVESLFMSADGSRIVSGSHDKTIKIWDALSGECLQTLIGHDDSVLSVCISADGSRIFSGSFDSNIKVWDALSGECLQTLEGGSDSVLSVCISADGSRLVSGSETIKVWDASSGECLQTLEGRSGSVSSVCISADGSRIVAGSYDKNIKVWSASSGECMQTFVGHSEGVTSVCISVDGSRIVSGSVDTAIKLWDTSSGECLQTLQGHSLYVMSVCISADGSRIVSGSYDMTLKVWDASYSMDFQQQSLPGHSDRVTSVCISKDGRCIVSGSRDKTIKMWDAWSGECLHTSPDHLHSVEAVCMSADGSRVVSDTHDDTIKVWDLSSGKCLHTLVGHVDNVVSSCIFPDGSRIVSGSHDKTIKIWDASSGECLRTLEGHDGSVLSVCISADESRIISGSTDETIKIWDASSGECLQTFEGHDSIVRSVCTSADGSRIVSGSDDKTIKVWDTSSGECLQTFVGHSDWVTSICVSPDGRQLLATYDGGFVVKLWDLSDSSTNFFPSSNDSPLTSKHVYGPILKTVGDISSISLCDGGLAVGTQSGQVHTFKLLH